MSLEIINGNWNLTEQMNEPVFVRQLQTGGTFVDRNIDIVITPKIGTLEFSANPSLIQQVIQQDDTYVLKTTAIINVEPIFSKGWVEDIESREVLAESAFVLGKTHLESQLLKDDGYPSGNSLYRVTATSGYNAEDLDKDIEVFQGEINY